MKTKEFIKKVKELGFEVREYDIDIDVINGNHDSICTVSTMFRFVLDTDWSSFETIEEKTREGLYKLAVEYASTPLEEREEEKRYVYKLPVLSTGSSTSFIQKFFSAIRIAYPNKRVEDLTGIYHFTDKEVEQYAGKARLLFDTCEKIEVTSND